MIHASTRQAFAHRHEQAEEDVVLSGTGRVKVDDALTDIGPTDAIRVAPQAVRGERLDWLLILNRRHLERVLRVFVEHYNAQRPHRALNLQPPQPPMPPPTPAIGEIRRHDRLGSLSTTEPPPEVRHK